MTVSDVSGPDVHVFVFYGFACAESHVHGSRLQWHCRETQEELARLELARLEQQRVEEAATSTCSFFLPFIHGIRHQLISTTASNRTSSVNSW